MNKTNERVGNITVFDGGDPSANFNYLMKRIEENLKLNKKCVVVKHVEEGRDTGKKQHMTDDNSSPAVIRTSDLSAISSELAKYDVIGIDEGDLFGDISALCDGMANHGKVVFVTGNKNGNKSKSFLNVIPVAEDVKLCSNCGGEGNATSSNVKTRGSHARFKKDGRLELFLGCMFSGKTTEMLKTMNDYENKGYKGLVVKHPIDTRYKTKKQCVSQNDKYSHDAIVSKRLFVILDKARDCDVVGIDEGQFFDDIAVICQRLKEAGKIVLVAALDGTYERKPFNNILDVVPIADKTEKRRGSKCDGCKGDGREGVAAFSFCISPGKGKVIIGAKDKFVPLCRRCYFKRVWSQRIQLLGLFFPVLRYTLLSSREEGHSKASPPSLTNGSMADLAPNRGSK